MPGSREKIGYQMPGGPGIFSVQMPGGVPGDGQGRN